MLAPWKNSRDKPRQCIKKQRQHFAHKGSCDQSYGFPSSHVWMWELDQELLLSDVMLEIKLVNPKGNQPWIFTERTDAEAEALILWPPDVKIHLLEKTLMLGKIEGGWQTMRWLDDIIYSMNMNLSKLQEIVEDQGTWCAIVHGIAKSWTWLSDWTTTTELS